MLGKLLKKPKNIREQYAFWGAVSTTGVIGLVWFMALSLNFQDGGPFAIDKSQQTASAFSQFFSEIKDDFLHSQSIQEDDIPVETPTETVSTTSENGSNESPKESPSGPPVMVATSSPRAVQVGTSSLQNR